MFITPFLSNTISIIQPYLIELFTTSTKFCKLVSCCAHFFLSKLEFGNVALERPIYQTYICKICIISNTGFPLVQLYRIWSSRCTTRHLSLHRLYLKKNVYLDVRHQQQSLNPDYNQLALDEV